jgi:hypothetical protein
VKAEVVLEGRGQGRVPLPTLDAEVVPHQVVQNLLKFLMYEVLEHQFNEGFNCDDGMKDLTVKKATVEIEIEA